MSWREAKSNNSQRESTSETIPILFREISRKRPGEFRDISRFFRTVFPEQFRGFSGNNPGYFPGHFTGHWIVTGQNLGNLKMTENPYKDLYKPIKPYKKNLQKPIKNL